MSDMLIHTFEPVFDLSSRGLVLGSFPSVRSRQEGFYYGHPANRFWKVLSAVFSCDIPDTIEDKRDMLLENNIALWDVIYSCEITGSSDSSIRNVIPNDIERVLLNSNIKTIYFNGATAARLYKKHIAGKDGAASRVCDTICLPSTSPANAGYSLSRLIKCWSVIKPE